MNTHDNQRSKNTKEKIENIFISLLNEKEITKISVQEICRQAHINRKTFYAHYQDIYDLMYKIEENLSSQIQYIFLDKQTEQQPQDSFMNLLQFIKEHQNFYKAYFNRIDIQHFAETTLAKRLNLNHNRLKSEIPLPEVAYHTEFFKTGLNATLRLWLNTGCMESPSEMAQIIQNEYSSRNI